MSSVIKYRNAFHDASEKAEKRIISHENLTLRRSNHVTTEQDEIDKKIERALFIEKEASEKAEQITNEASQLYNETLQKIEIEKNNWQMEKDRWINEAREQGFQEGYQSGLTTGENEYKQYINHANAVLEKAKQESEHIVKNSEETILKVGLKVAERILGTYLQSHPEDFSHLVRQSLKEFKDNSEIQVYVHPTYYSEIQTQKEELMSLFTKDIQLFIYPNPDLKETDCIIESSNGRIDTSIDSQLTEMKSKLLALLEED